MLFVIKVYAQVLHVVEENIEGVSQVLVDIDGQFAPLGLGETVPFVQPKLLDECAFAGACTS